MTRWLAHSVTARGKHPRNSEVMHAVRHVRVSVCQVKAKWSEDRHDDWPRCRRCCLLLGVRNGFGPIAEPVRTHAPMLSDEARQIVGRIRRDARTYITRFVCRLDREAA